MATAKVKHEAPQQSPGPCKMAASNDEGLGKSGEQSFSAMQGLILAEDRRTKEKEMNLQNLMEYREAPASPSASSVTTTLSIENGGSPDTPNSPSTQDQTEMDHERLPNELLDELCEDIGMGDGSELDFVEFLMEQDVVDPQQYMTPEALRSSGFPTPTNKSQTNSALNTPTSKTSNENWGNNTRNCGSPSYSTASSTNVTVATSSGSSSPVSKRFHLSNSGPPSPPTLSHTANHVFKAPQTPPTSRRPASTPQGAMSPRSNLSVSSNQSNHSDHSSHSNHSVHSNPNNQNNIPQRCFSPKTGYNVSAQLPHSTTGGQAFNKPPPQYGQFPGQMGQKKTINQPYQRFGRPVPPNVNVQTFQQENNKFLSSNVSQGGASSCAMNSGTPDNMGMSVPNQTNNSQFNRPLESPLDQGYFTSSDSMSTRSLDSATSTVPSSVQSSIQSLNSQNKPLNIGASPQQKSVHFADNTTANCTRQNGGLPYEPCYRNNVPDCELEEYRNSLQKMHNKMMPRLNHHGKPETAPYTVPTNTGQTMNPFDYPNANTNMQQQQFDYQQKSPSARFGMENNQNMVMPGFNDNISNQSNLSNLNCPMPNTPMGPMHQGSVDGFRGQGAACQMQDPSKGPAMYDSITMQNTMVKNSSNCQYSGATQGNMNENCSMMGMNQGMMVNGHMSQGNMNPNYGNGQYQGMPSHSQHGYQGQGQRNMNMAAGSAGASAGMMGYDPQFDQNRAMGAGNMNMGNMDASGGMYQQGQGSNIADTMGWNGNMPQTPQSHMAPQTGPMNMGGQGMGMGQGCGQCGQLSGIPCVIPNCSNCKNISSSNRPAMMENQQRFIQHLITDRSNAFRSHPLFPLLRDLIIADMNFSTPNFPYQLISNLPADFNKLLQNFLHRNPPQGNYQANYAVESVVMDALKYAHLCLIEKIRQKQEQETDKHSKTTSKSLSAIEEFCEKFDESVRKNYIKPASLNLGAAVGGSGMGVGPHMGAPMGPGDMSTPQKDLKYQMGMGNMMMYSSQAKKGLEFGSMMSPGFKLMPEFDAVSDCGSVVSSSSHPNKPESKKHPSLPKEAVAIMLDWLRQHKDNPYPNDDEKAMLIKQTGLSINQINYWFTNARRRILPKWAQQCKS